MPYLTETIIRETVEAMCAPEAEKQVLLQLALQGNPAARAAVLWLRHQQAEVPPYAVRKSLREATLAVGRKGRA